MRRVLVGGLVLGASGVGLMAMPRSGVDYTPRALGAVDDVDAFVARKLAQSQAKGAWPTATERLSRHHEGVAPEAFLYLHGFGASRGEGEFVMERLAEERGANVYYVRLPGHGTDMEDHAAATAIDYLDTVTEALELMPSLGEKVVVVGTSTGGLLGTWLAGTYPDAVDALVVASPLYGFRDPTATPLLTARGGLTLGKLAMGQIRDTSWEHERKVDGYDERWLLQQRFEALVPLEQIRRKGTEPSVLARVKAPALGFVYWADEENRDTVIDVPRVGEVFDAFGGSEGHSANRVVEVRDGSHVLMSEYVRTDKELIHTEVMGFLDETIGSTRAPSAEPEPPLDEAPPDGAADPEAG